MGESKGRRAPSEADRLPDFIFGRDKAAEQAGRFILAGMLAASIPKSTKEPSERETSEEISEIIQKLTRMAQRDPHLEEASIWRNEPPPDALNPPFPEAAVRKDNSLHRRRRARRPPQRPLLLDDSALADMMGRH
jgi:hypothetical protein